jgi:hypothetical protein
MVARKNDQKFMELVAKHGRLDETTGNVRFEGMYASVHIDIGWNGTVVSVPHSHVVWFLKYGRWPKEGFQLDHIDDDPMNNVPSNLAELTPEENQRKRRGRTISRTYGTGKYGYGIYVHHSKRDDRFYARRYLSRGHHGKFRHVRKGLGGFDTLREAEAAIAECISMIKIHGEDYLPKFTRKPKEASIALMAAYKKMRELRSYGLSFDKISLMLGFSVAAIFKRTKDVVVGDVREISGIDIWKNKHRVRLDKAHVGYFETRDLAVAGRKDAVLKHYAVSS